VQRGGRALGRSVRHRGPLCCLAVMPLTSVTSPSSRLCSHLYSRHSQVKKAVEHHTIESALTDEFDSAISKGRVGAAALAKMYREAEQGVYNGWREEDGVHAGNLLTDEEKEVGVPRPGSSASAAACLAVCVCATLRSREPSAIVRINRAQQHPPVPSGGADRDERAEVAAGGARAEASDKSRRPTRL
jgi:hypothetical protein